MKEEGRKEERKEESVFYLSSRGTPLSAAADWSTPDINSAKNNPKE